MQLGDARFWRMSRVEGLQVRPDGAFLTDV